MLLFEIITFLLETMRAFYTFKKLRFFSFKKHPTLILRKWFLFIPKEIIACYY